MQNAHSATTNPISSAAAGFRATHVANSEKWVLHIDDVQKQDEDVYECQISSEPKMSLPFKLKVIGRCFQFVLNRNNLRYNLKIRCNLDR